MRARRPIAERACISYNLNLASFGSCDPIVPTSFPVFDLAAFEQAGAERRRALGREVDDICRSTGFLAVANHGVAQGVIDSVWGKAKAFFDLPFEEKEKAKAPFKGYPYGYLGPELEALAKSRNVDTPPDLKESFNGGPAVTPPGVTDADALSFCYAPTIWPENPQGFVEAWRRGSCVSSPSRCNCPRIISQRSSTRRSAGCGP